MIAALEIISVIIVLGVIGSFGAQGIYSLLGMLIVWQLIYRLKYGYWMRGIDH